MVPIKSILVAIDANYKHLESNFELAKKSMGIKPDLEAAHKHACEVSLAVHALAQLDAQARALYGISLPLDMIQKINHRQAELLTVVNEIAACRQMLQVRTQTTKKVVLN